MGSYVSSAGELSQCWCSTTSHPIGAISNTPDCIACYPFSGNLCLGTGLYQALNYSPVRYNEGLASFLCIDSC